jgi:hypothetical protein
MKTNSCTRIFVLTFLFFSFSAIAKDTHAFNVERGTTKFTIHWTAAHVVGSSKFKNACDARSRETKSTFLATMHTKERGRRSKLKPSYAGACPNVSGYVSN